MNWISVKDKLPESREERFLALIDNQIYIGSFSAIESYNLNDKLYVKQIDFTPFIPLNHVSCDDCESSENKCGNQCTDCCEEDYAISLLIPSFGLDKVTHWMPLPNKPNEENIRNS